MVVFFKICTHIDFLFIDSFSGCDWTMDTWSCCSSSHLCGVMEGDCDNDQDCKDLLLCGSDNCMYFFSETADCCYDPMPPYGYPGKKIILTEVETILFPSGILGQHDRQ